MAKPLPRSTPSAQGIDPAAISRFIDTVQAQKGLELHSIMILRHGHVVASGWWKPYTPQMAKMLFSLSKSFTSTAVGFAVAEGLLSVEDPVLPFFKTEVPVSPGKYWDELKVRHLLSMNTGHEEDTTFFMLGRADGGWVNEFFSQPIKHKPGTYFLYNTGATYILSAIVQKLTGQRVLDYLTPRLFEPLGIKGAQWEQSPEGYDAGGFGLEITTEDIARFGQFMLQCGQWEGKQLLPAAWVDEATRKHSDNSNNQTDPDWTAGYGYQFWHCVPGCYRGDGAFGQYCVVIPAVDTVIAITSGVDNMQAVLTHLWNCLLPGIGTGQPADVKADAVLAEKLAAAKYNPPTANCSSPVEAALSGKVFSLEPNTEGISKVKFDFIGGTCDVTFTVGKDDIHLACGRGHWQEGLYAATVNYSVTPRSNLPVAASFTWEKDDTLLLTARDLGSPFVMTWKAVFTADSIGLVQSVNVCFGPTQLPVINGKME